MLEQTQHSLREVWCGEVQACHMVVEDGFQCPDASSSINVPFSHSHHSPSHLHSVNSGFWNSAAITLAPYEWLNTIAFLPQLVLTLLEMSSAIFCSPPFCAHPPAAAAAAATGR